MSERKPTFAELLARGVRKEPKRKVVVAEVSARMHAAVKANPEKLRMIAEDEHGNAVIERPARPQNPLVRGQLAPRDERFVPDHPTSAVGQIKWGNNTFGNGIGNAFHERGGRGDKFVVSDYDPVLVFQREQDR